MKPYAPLLLVLSTVLLDLSAAPGATLFGVRPSLTLVVIGLWAALRPPSEAMLIAPAAGVLLGLLGPEPLGLSVLGFVPVVLLGSFARPRGTERRWPAAVGAVIAGTAAYLVILIVCAPLFGAMPPLGLGVLRPIAIVMVLNGALAALLYWPIALAGQTRPTRRAHRLASMS